MMFSLEKTTGKRAYLLIAMGLGLGIGFAVSLHSFPFQVKASPTFFASERIQLEITRIKSPELGFDVDVESGSLELLPLVQLGAPAVHLNTSANIGQGQAIVIQGTRANYSFSDLDKAQLGQEILVLGSNGGWYRYRIVETREISYDQLSQLFTQNQETVVLFVTNPFQQSVTAVLARPLH